MKAMILALPLLALAACDLPSGAAVSDFNGVSVKVVANSLSTRAEEESQAKATSICAKGGKAHAERESARGLPDYQV